MNNHDGNQPQHPNSKKHSLEAVSPVPFQGLPVLHWERVRLRPSSMEQMLEFRDCVRDRTRRVMLEEGTVERGDAQKGFRLVREEDTFTIKRCERNLQNYIVSIKPEKASLQTCIISVHGGFDHTCHVMSNLYLYIRRKEKIDQVSVSRRLSI